MGWQATPELRFVKRSRKSFNPPYVERILQQKWRRGVWEMYEGARKDEEWRDVPLVETPPTEQDYEAAAGNYFEPEATVSEPQSRIDSMLEMTGEYIYGTKAWAMAQTVKVTHTDPDIDWEFPDGVKQYEHPDQDTGWSLYEPAEPEHTDMCQIWVGGDCDCREPTEPENKEATGLTLRERLEHNFKVKYPAWQIQGEAKDRIDELEGINQNCNELIDQLWTELHTDPSTQEEDHET